LACKIFAAKIVEVLVDEVILLGTIMSVTPAVPFVKIFKITLKSVAIALACRDVAPVYVVT
jgi:hypothetical protein